MEKETLLKEMQVGDRINDWAPGVDVVCVPGGWMFITYASPAYADDSISITAVFVPNN